jgi:hypothetical protein
MFIETEGKCPINMDMLDKIVNFAASYLQIVDDAWLTIKFSANMEQDVCGWCGEIDIDEKWIEIEVNRNLSLYNLVATIFHEMVHCKQILDGRLIQGCPSVWEGAEYDDYYFELPWEVEAYELERQMVEMYES